MTKRQFEAWCSLSGYITCTDWNIQTINNREYYFIINPKTDKFALIREDMRIDNYEILVSGWTDYNGYAEKFHEETEGVWK